MATTRAPRAAEGVRVYAIGDIHGRSDLLKAMLQHIAQDAKNAVGQRMHLILLGDLIDRGPDSNLVLSMVAEDLPSVDRVTILCGNHEEAMIDVLDGRLDQFGKWLGYGGAETLQSYGLDAWNYPGSHVELAKAFVKAVPDVHRTLLRRLQDSETSGDYFFVHAGIRPGIAIDRQKVADTRWIRRSFLDSTDDHGVVVVHGHSIAADVAWRPNRIGIDTGAYESGILTCLVLEDDRRWLFQTVPGGGVERLESPSS